MTFCPFFNGLDNRFTTCRQIWFYSGHGQPGAHKGVILIPCNNMITSEQTGNLLLENLYKRFGLPDKIISDRGPQFTSNSFKELLKILGIKSALSTAYHPQTDGTTERTNQEIEAYLSIYCTSYLEDWLKALHLMEFTNDMQTKWKHPSNSCLENLW